ncbi:hypothetical protein ACN6K5_003603 [Streptomyces violaceoruber]|uniref:hypothetical protein n=1 Tax=Streptomyces violaceoruber TaxID=1935 RepID=UPI00403D50D7
MQCKDIPNGLFLEAVREAQGPATVVTRWRVHAALEELLGPVPEKIVLAKAKKLIRSGKLDGCACGCRGDFQIPAPPTIDGHGIWVQRLLDQANGRVAP